MVSVLLRYETDDNSDSAIRNAKFSAVLSEYTDVFPEELRKGLPPSLTNEYLKIELKAEAKPIKEGLFRVYYT